MEKLFNSKYPFVCLGMNKVSDSNLAISISKSGGIPTLSFYNFIQNGMIDYHEADIELNKFYEACPTGELIISISEGAFLSENFYNLFLKYQFKFIELIFENLIITGIEIDKSSEPYILNVIKESKKFKSAETKFLLKSLTRFVIIEFEKKFPELIDAYILKGEHGAGRVVERKTKFTLEEEINLIKKVSKDVQIIPAGGIDYKNAKRFLEIGCPAVGFGTLFALSIESPIPLHTKNKLILNSSVEKISNTHNGVLFSNTIQHDDDNNTKALIAGINTSTQGLVYAGVGIKDISEVKSINQIILELVENIL
jgi:hypothetical protein